MGAQEVWTGTFVCTAYDAVDVPCRSGSAGMGNRQNPRGFSSPLTITDVGHAIREKLLVLLRCRWVAWPAGVKVAPASAADDPALPPSSIWWDVVVNVVVPSFVSTMS